MDFSNQYNGWKSTRKERRLRKKEGYIKTPNIGGSGFPGYVRSKALTVQNALKLSNRAAHHAEARQARANGDFAPEMPPANSRARASPDPEMKMTGIDLSQLRNTRF